MAISMQCIGLVPLRRHLTRTTPSTLPHTVPMRPRDILAKNLRAFMAARPELNTLPKLTARSGVTNGTLHRIRRAAVSTRIDELPRLGDAFGVEPCDLLCTKGTSPLIISVSGRL